MQDAADQNHSDDADHHNQSDRDDLGGLLLDIPASSSAAAKTLHTEAVSQSGIAQVPREREHCAARVPLSELDRLMHLQHTCSAQSSVVALSAHTGQ